MIDLNQDKASLYTQLERTVANKTLEDLSQDQQQNIVDGIQAIRRKHSGYTTHWDIHISGDEDFFSHMSDNLRALSQQDALSDPGLAKLLVNTTASIFLGAESVRDFAYIDLYTRKTVHHPDDAHISGCESSVASLYAELGLFEESMDHYLNARRVAGRHYTYQRDRANAGLDHMLSLYVRSDQTIDAVEVQREQRKEDLVRNANYSFDNRMDDIESLPGLVSQTTLSVNQLRDQLGSLGYDGEDVPRELRSMYATAAHALNRALRGKTTQASEMYTPVVIEYLRGANDTKSADTLEVQFLQKRKDALEQVIDQADSTRERFEQLSSEVPEFYSPEVAEVWIDRIEGERKRINERLTELEAKQ